MIWFHVEMLKELFATYANDQEVIEKVIWFLIKIFISD